MWSLLLTLSQSEQEAGLGISHLFRADYRRRVWTLERLHWPCALGNSLHSSPHVSPILLKVQWWCFATTFSIGVAPVHGPRLQFLARLPNHQRPSSRTATQSLINVTKCCRQRRNALTHDLLLLLIYESHPNNLDYLISSTIISCLASPAVIMSSNTQIMQHVSAGDARSFAEHVLVGNGVSKDNAVIVARCLVEADLRGVDTHGM